MKITPISNNSYQKQQSFGAIPGQNFSKGLAEFLENFYDSEKQVLQLLRSGDDVGSFIVKFRNDIKLNSNNLGKIDPTIDISRIDNHNFRISASLSGIEQDSGVWLNPKEIPACLNPLREILKWAKIVTSEFQQRYMPFIGKSKDQDSVNGITNTITEWMYQLQK